MKCSVCGGNQFAFTPVLWKELVDAWQLNDDEVRYINRQQGENCKFCGSNLRSIVLADAILNATRVRTKTLNKASKSWRSYFLDILEVNEAGTLHMHLKGFRRHTFAQFPQVDMSEMPYSDGSFDVVIHSDTLEHIDDPIRALRECCRVLKPNGSLCFTVPTVVGRLSRSREGLSNSFHGASRANAPDYLVHTEFGADVWTYPMRAGFSRTQVFTREYPAALAILATK